MSNIYAFTDFETTGVNPLVDLPIEIGIIFTDYNFNILTSYEALIRQKKVLVRINGIPKWKPEFREAFEVHNISPEEYIKKAKPPQAVCTEIRMFCQSLSKNPSKEIYIVSDNPYFEQTFIRKLFGQSQTPFPFHYNARGTLMITDLAGVRSHAHTHRGLEDIKGTYMDFIEACKKLNLLKEEKEIFKLTKGEILG